MHTTEQAKGRLYCKKNFFLFRRFKKHLKDAQCRHFESSSQNLREHKANKCGLDRTIKLFFLKLKNRYDFLQILVK